MFYERRTRFSDGEPGTRNRCSLGALCSVISPPPRPQVTRHFLRRHTGDYKGTGLNSLLNTRRKGAGGAGAAKNIGAWPYCRGKSAYPYEERSRWFILSVSKIRAHVAAPNPPPTRPPPYSWLVFRLAERRAILSLLLLASGFSPCLRYLGYPPPPQQFILISSSLVFHPLYSRIGDLSTPIWVSSARSNGRFKLHLGGMMPSAGDDPFSCQKAYLPLKFICPPSSFLLRMYREKLTS